MKRLEWFYQQYCADPKLKQKKRREELEQLHFAATSDNTSAAIDVPSEDYQLHDKMEFEHALMEFSLAGSPFDVLDRTKKLEMLFEEGVPGLQDVIESDSKEIVLPVTVKEWKERPQRNGQLFAFIKFATIDGNEFDAPAFSGVWRYISPTSPEPFDHESPQPCRRGSVYIVTFNRDDDDPESLKVGFSGWRHTKKSVKRAWIDIDSLV
jgi:DNA polymerase III alpha subunit